MTYKTIQYCLTLALLLISCSVINAQDRADNTTWASFSLSKDMGDGWTAVLKPIHRRQNDFKDNQNSSIDYIVRKKLSTNYAAQILGRTWFMPNRANRQFIFIDFMQNIPIGTTDVAWRNRYRIHYAFDIEDNIDGDFFRLDSQLSLNKDWKIKPFIGAEPFFRIDGDNNEIQRIRYSIGGKYKINDKLGLSAQYWREAFYGNNTNADFNIWVVNLGIKL